MKSCFKYPNETNIRFHPKEYLLIPYNMVIFSCATTVKFFSSKPNWQNNFRGVIFV